MRKAASEQNTVSCIKFQFGNNFIREKCVYKVNEPRESVLCSPLLLLSTMLLVYAVLLTYFICCVIRLYVCVCVAFWPTKMLPLLFPSAAKNRRDDQIPGKTSFSVSAQNEFHVALCLINNTFDGYLHVCEPLWVCEFALPFFTSLWEAFRVVYCQFSLCTRHTLTALKQLPISICCLWIQIALAKWFANTE